MAIANDNRMTDSSHPPLPLVFPFFWLLIFLNLSNHYNYNLKLHAPNKCFIAPFNLLLLSVFKNSFLFLHHPLQILTQWCKSPSFPAHPWTLYYTSNILNVLLEFPDTGNSLFKRMLLQYIILKIKLVSKVKITLNNFELFTVSKHSEILFFYQYL